MKKKIFKGRNLKRHLSLFLVMVMVFTLLPLNSMTAYAWDVSNTKLSEFVYDGNNISSLRVQFRLPDQAAGWPTCYCYVGVQDTKIETNGVSLKDFTGCDHETSKEALLSNNGTYSLKTRYGIKALSEDKFQAFGDYMQIDTTVKMPSGISLETGNDYYFYLWTTREKGDKCGADSCFNYNTTDIYPDAYLGKMTITDSGVVEYEDSAGKVKKFGKHSCDYTATGNNLIAKCKGTENGCTFDPCDCCTEETVLKLTLTADSPTYFGSGVTTSWGYGETVGFTLTGEDTWKEALGNDSVPTVMYEGTGSTIYDKSATAPTEMGTYKATITKETATAEMAFEITEPHVHSYGEASYTWTDDGRMCSAVKTCECNNEITEQATIISEVKIPATCIAKGTTTYTATFGSENGFTTQNKDIADIDTLGHTWAYSASGANLTAICGNDNTHIATLTLIATSQTYSGDVVTASYGSGEVEAWKTATKQDAPTITYEKNDNGEWTAIDSAPSEIGKYRAIAKFTDNSKEFIDSSADYIAYKEFEIKKFISSTSSGPSSSAGGSSSSESNKPTEDFSIPVKNGNTVKVEAEIKDGTANVSEITSETIDKVINNKGETKVDTITIDLSGAKQEVTGVTLSIETVKTLATTTASKDNGIDTATIELSKASVVLDSKTLETVAKEAAGNEIKLVVDDKERSKLNTLQQTAIKNYHVATSFEAYFESNGKEIHDFNGGTATVAINFKPEEGKSMDYYHLVHIADDGKLTRYKTKYTKGKLMFTTTHFSDYVVIYDESEKNETGSEKTVAVTGVTAKVDKTTLTKKGQSVTIKAVVQPADATNNKVLYTSSNKKVATVDKNGKVTAVANGTTTITIKTEDGLFTKKIVFTVKIPSPMPTKAQIVANGVALNSKATAKWTKENYLRLEWGKVTGAVGYEVYVRKCDGKTLWTKPAYTAKSGNVLNVTLKKLGGKKFSTTANYKYGVHAYKYVNGKKVYMGTSLSYHFVGSNNKKETNVKSIIASKKTITLGVKKTTKLTAKVTKVNTKRALLKHDTLVRYISSNSSVAKVDLRTGKVTGVKAGKCKIYCIALNGVKATVSVTVK